MKNTNLISISGKKRHGKDTVAKMIIKIIFEEKGILYSKRAFGDKVKEVAAVLTGIPADQWETDEQKATLLPPQWDTFDEYGLKRPITRRKFMTKLGSDAITGKLHKHAFVNAVFDTYTPESKWVVSDVRFFTELNRIRQYNGVTVRVTDPRKVDPADVHASEVELDGVTDWDYRIVNDGTLEELEHKVRVLLVRLKLI